MEEKKSIIEVDMKGIELLEAAKEMEEYMPELKKRWLKDEWDLIWNMMVRMRALEKQNEYLIDKLYKYQHECRSKDGKTYHLQQDIDKIHEILQREHEKKVKEEE